MIVVKVLNEVQQFLPLHSWSLATHIQSQLQYPPVPTFLLMKM